MLSEEDKAKQTRAWVLARRARALDEQGMDPDVVEDLYSEALSLAPDDLRIRRWLGTFYIDVGLPLMADQVIMARPLSSYAWSDNSPKEFHLPIAQAYYDHGHYDRAQEILQAIPVEQREEARGLLRLVDHALSRKALGASMFPPRFSADRWWVPVELPAALHVDGRGVTRTSWSPGYVLEVAHTGVTLLMLDEAQKLVRRTLSMAELATPTQLFEGYIAFLGAPSGVVSGVHVEVAQYEGLGYLLAPRESARWYSIQAEDRWRSEDPYRYVELAYSPSGTPSW